MVGPARLADPDLLVLCVVVLSYVAVRALALYDQHVASAGGDCSSDNETSRSP